MLRDKELKELKGVNRPMGGVVVSISSPFTLLSLSLKTKPDGRKRI